MEAPESKAISLLSHLSDVSANDGRAFQKDRIEQLNDLIREEIKSSLSEDKQTAEDARSALKRISQTLEEYCRGHRREIKSFCVSDSAIGTCENHVLALRYLGPIALRAYLNSAKQQGQCEEGFIENCHKATIEAINSHRLLLENRSKLDSNTLKLTLQAMREMSSVVEAKDLPAFQNIFQTQRNQQLGHASLRAMISLENVLMDPNMTPEARGAAIEAVGTACSAHDVFFRAVRNLLIMRRDLPKPMQYLLNWLMETFVKDLEPAPIMEKALRGHASPSEIVAYFATLLKSSDKQNRLRAAQALGQIVRLAMTFVEVIVEMPAQITEDLAPGPTRDVFLTGSSSFEAIFALADAATGDDPDLRKEAFKSLNDIFESSTEQRQANESSEPNQPQINVVVRKLVALLKPSERHVVENEALNTLLVIPSATQETVSRMETVERTPGRDDEVSKHAGTIKDRLRGLADTTAKGIEDEFGQDTDLYMARRYFLILRLYGRSMPKRLKVYFTLLDRLAKPESKADLPVKRLVTKEALEAFQNARGEAREFEKSQLKEWQDKVVEWTETYGTGRNRDLIIRQNLQDTKAEIGRLILEGYSIQHRLWRWFRELHPATKVPVVAGVIWGLLITSIIVLWLIAPWQLAMWAMENPMSERIPIFSKRLTNLISLVHWLGCSNRALDAWIARYREILMRQTFQLERERAPLGADAFNRVEYLIDHYVDLGNQKDIDTFCNKIQKVERIAVWIEGEGGGSGKTTLACYMAHMASVRGQHAVIPVMINMDWGQSLLDGVRDVCQFNDRRLTLPMIRNLAGRGRIILIVDGLSEIRDGLDGEHRGFRHILVTSRNKSPEDKAFFRTVKVGSLAIHNSDRLREFISRYASEEETREQARKLIEGLGDQKGQIRPIFAWLAVEYAKTNAGPESEKGSTSHLDLIMQYVELLRPRGPHALSIDSYVRSAELAAYTEIHQNWSPRMVLRETVQSRLHEEGKKLPFRTVSMEEIPGDVVLEQLEQCGLLQSGSVGQSTPILQRRYISFTYDIVAEYLAAGHVSMWPELPPSTRKEIEESNSDFAKVLETVMRAIKDRKGNREDLSPRKTPS